MKRNIYGGWYDPTGNSDLAEGVTEELESLTADSVRSWRGYISGNMEFHESMYIDEFDKKSTPPDGIIATSIRNT